MLARHKCKEPSYRVRWLISPKHRLELYTSLVAGAHAMARTGALLMTLEPLKDPDALEHTVRWDVQEARQGVQRKIAVDGFDRNDLFDFAALREVDVYFKRNYSRQALQPVPKELRSKIQPAGILFACFTEGSRRLSTKAALVSFSAELSTGGIGNPRSALSRLAHNLDHILGYLQLSDCERQPDDALHDRVVFQTRIWPGESDPAIDRRSVNETRIGIARALRAEFGSSELIGLIRTPFAERTAPDALLSRRVSRREYARQLRTSMIAVNSHGLDGSAGYKIGESLAAGCALVSQPFLFELQEPMVPEVNYLPFKTPEECVAQCTRLLVDRQLAERMRAANQQYYRDFVQPGAYVRGLLARAFLAP